MNQKINGSDHEQKPPVAIIRTVLPESPHVNSIRYTLNNGMYLGSLRVEATSVAALRQMAADFQNWVTEATSGLAVASALPPDARKQA